MELSQCIPAELLGGSQAEVGNRAEGVAFSVDRGTNSADVESGTRLRKGGSRHQGSSEENCRDADERGEHVKDCKQWLRWKLMQYGSLFIPPGGYPDGKILILRHWQNWSHSAESLSRKRWLLRVGLSYDFTNFRTYVNSTHCFSHGRSCHIPMHYAYEWTSYPHFSQYRVLGEKYDRFSSNLIEWARSQGTCTGQWDFHCGAVYSPESSHCWILCCILNGYVSHINLTFCKNHDEHRWQVEDERFDMLTPRCQDKEVVKKSHRITVNDGEFSETFCDGLKRTRRGKIDDSGTL